MANHHLSEGQLSGDSSTSRLSAESASNSSESPANSANSSDRRLTAGASKNPETAHFFERFAPVGWVFFAVVVAAQLFERWSAEELPDDLSAYIAAAQTFLAGENPYGPALYQAPDFSDFLFVYPPGTLPLVSFLGFLPARPLALVELVVHAAALVGALLWLRRRFSLTVPAGWLAALTCAFYIPAVTDITVGNLTSYMLLAWVGCMALAHRPTTRPIDIFWAILLGIVLVFKPMWGLPAGLVLLVRQRWALAAGLLGGAGIVAALSFVPWHGEVLVNPWLDQVEATATFYKAVDLPSLAPMLYLPAIILWLGAGVALTRRLGAKHPSLWLWAAASLVVWPRIGLYSYVISLPLIFYCWQQRGRNLGLAVSLPVILMWFVLAPFFSEDIHQWTYRLGLYIWAWALAAIVFAILWREGDNLSPMSG